MTKIQTFIFSNLGLFLSFFLPFIQASTKILSSVSSHLRIQRIMKRLLLLLATFTFIFFFFLVKRRVDRWGASNFNFHPRSLKKKAWTGKRGGRRKRKNGWWTSIIVRIPSYEFGGRPKAGAKSGMRTIQREEQWFFIAPPRNRFNGSSAPSEA